MTKPLCVIAGPMNTRSGYGDMSRDIVRHIIALDRYEVKLISLPWGNTPMNALQQDNPLDAPILAAIIPPPYALPRQPEVFIQISVPNEFRPQGKYNIGITAGIETTLCSVPWIEGCNRMDTVWTISEHSKRVFESTVVSQRTQDGKELAPIKVTVPVEVLHNCVHTDVFKKIDSSKIEHSIRTALTPIKEEFCFLFVGHWLPGNIGEDRKNVGLLVHTFCHTFKDTPTSKRPALILKTSGGNFSILDKDEIIKKINMIRQQVGPSCPNVYFIHGELTESEMNSLMNHHKVKVHVSFTKGEGFGRPLLEATQSHKPVMASGWSGHTDFLNPDDAFLLNGELKNVEAGSVWQDVIIPESQWFNVDVQNAANAMRTMFKHYDKFLDGAAKLGRKNAEKFSYVAIQNRTDELLAKYVPAMVVPTHVPMQLPQLRKIVG